MRGPASRAQLDAGKPSISLPLHFSPLGRSLTDSSRGSLASISPPCLSRGGVSRRSLAPPSCLRTRYILGAERTSSGPAARGYFRQRPNGGGRPRGYTTQHATTARKEEGAPLSAVTQHCRRPRRHSCPRRDLPSRSYFRPAMVQCDGGSDQLFAFLRSSN